MKNRLLKNQDGMVLLTSLMLMVILFVLGTTAYLITSNDLKIGGNFKTSKQAFYVAEAGIQHAVGLLREREDYDAILQNNAILIGSDADFAGGTYDVVVTDNDDGDGNLNLDQDKKVYITSTGSKDGATAAIRVLFLGNYVPFPVPGAVAILGDGPGLGIQGSAAAVSGLDHDLPADFSCQGSGCEGPANGSGDNVPGLYVEVPEASIDPSDYQDELIVGPPGPTIYPNVVGAPPVSFDNDSTLAEWLDRVETYSANADVHLDGSQTIASNTAYGDRDNPVVVVVDGDANIHGAGNVDGAGILIVKGSLRVSGTLHWEGIVIVSDDAAVEVDATGRFTLLGAMLVVPSDASYPASVALAGHASMSYSGAAMNNMSTVFDNAEILSWENIYH